MEHTCADLAKRKIRAYTALFWRQSLDALQVCKKDQQNLAKDELLFQLDNLKRIIGKEYPETIQDQNEQPEGE